METVAPADVDHAARVESLRKIYPNGTEALRPISFEVPQGQFVSIVGPSGCGKSTLLRLLSGIEPPTSGRIWVHGEPVDGAREDVGFMFQAPTLLPWRTALQNVLLPVEVRDGATAAGQYRERAEELLHMVGLHHARDVLPDQLSGGMAQRVAMCRMLISDPELLLLDEPFGALDELKREQMNGELQTLLEGTRRTAIMVTHSISEAVFLSDAVLVMNGTGTQIAVPVPLDRPRTFDIVTSAAFTRVAKEVRSALRPEHLEVGDLEVKHG